MSKLTLNNVGNLIDATTAATVINDNSAAIVAAMDNTLSRDGTSPNQMGSDFDMNSHKILNLPAATSDTEPLRKKEFDDYTQTGNLVDSVNGQTGVVVLDADDISDTASAHKFTTSSDITRLANTSGTNTGDQTSVSGNAGTATKLATARNINGVAFDGTADITVADSTKVPTTRTVNGHALSTDVTVTKSDVGLGNVDNTSDLNKPISTAQATVNSSKVTGPASAVDTRIAIFDGITGKLIKDSGYQLPGSSLVGVDAAQTLTNKTYDTALNTFKVYGFTYAPTGLTGTGSAVLNTSPTLTTPNIVGTATNNNASAGSVGEFVTGNRARSSAISATSDTPISVTSISLTAGDWDVWGSLGLTGNSTAIGNIGAYFISDDIDAPEYVTIRGANMPNAWDTKFPVGPRRLSLSVTTTVNLYGKINFSSGTANLYGTISARRAR